jgi:hypothetical protein
MEVEIRVQHYLSFLLFILCAREREVGRHPAEGFLQQLAALLQGLQGLVDKGEGDTIFFLSAYLLRNPEPHRLNMEVILESLFGLHVK